MKRILFTLLSLGAFGCGNGSDSTDGKLLPIGTSAAPAPTASTDMPGGASLAAPGNAQQHVAGPDDPKVGTLTPRSITPPGATPVESARLHGCTKITYSALGALLESRGVSLDGKAAGKTPNADAKDPAAAKGTADLTPGALYKGGASALGVANYGGRVPESLIGSTSAMAKQFDIFVAAAPVIAAAVGDAPGCPGVKILDDQSHFTKDGVSCLLGKLAKDEHVTVANQAVTDAVNNGATSDEGLALAIAALLEAAHTCE